MALRYPQPSDGREDGPASTGRRSLPQSDQAQASAPAPDLASPWRRSRRSVEFAAYAMQNAPAATAHPREGPLACTTAIARPHAERRWPAPRGCRQRSGRAHLSRVAQPHVRPTGQGKTWACASALTSGAEPGRELIRAYRSALAWVVNGWRRCSEAASRLSVCTVSLRPAH